MKRAFFLGANGPTGFYSLYAGFTDPARERLHILKGGPGSGKSTLMGRLAQAWEARGGETERIYCSGDPASLDGVKLLGLDTAFVDGTSPHVIEPVYAGSGDNYVNLSDYYDKKALRARHGDIMALTRAYKAAYAEAYRRIGAAAQLRTPTQGPTAPAEALAAALFPPLGGEGRETRRFLSALTCQGRLTLWDTVPALAHRVYALSGNSGAAMNALAARAQAAGYDTLRCPNPLSPEETEAVFVPALGLAFVPEGYPGAAEHIDLPPKPEDPLETALLAEAEAHLKEAKARHDELEAVYAPYVDFGGIDALTERLITEVMG